MSEVQKYDSLTLIIIIIDNFCIVLFSGVPKLTALYNILQHFMGENETLPSKNNNNNNKCYAHIGPELVVYLLSQ